MQFLMKKSWRKWIALGGMVGVCLFGNLFALASDSSFPEAPVTTISLNFTMQGSVTILVLESKTELPSIHHEMLKTQEGFVLHFSRKVEFPSEGAISKGSLLIFPSSEDQKTSLLVLSPGISSLNKNEQTSTRISYTILGQSTELTKYYGDKVRKLENNPGREKALPDNETFQLAGEKQRELALVPAPTDKPPDPDSPKRRKGPAPSSPRNWDLPPPLKISGSVAAGYFHASTENGLTISRETLLNNLRLNVSGYLHHPRFLTFEIKPQVSFGRQSSETIMPDGKGLSVTSTFLGGGSFPLTVTYTRLNRQLVTFGALDRLAGLQADSSQDSLVLSWQLLLPHLPQFNFSYSQYNDQYKPLSAITSQVENRSRIFSVQASDKRWGWLWNSEFRVEGSDTDLLNVFEPTQSPFRFTRQTKQFRASGSREITSWMHVDLFGGHTSSQNQIESHPFDQNFTYLYGNITFRQGEKLSGLVRAGITSNLVGFQLAQSFPSFLAQTSPLLPQSGISVLETGQARSTLKTFSGQLQYSLTKDLRLDGQFTHNTTRSPTFQAFTGRDTTQTTLGAGFNYSHHFRWGQVQSHYAANVGRFDYGRINNNRTIGQNGSVSVTVGTVDRIELTGTVQGNWQRVTGNVLMQNRDWGSGLSLSRKMIGGVNFRASYNLDKNFFESNGSHFDSNLQSWLVAATHRRGEFSFSRQLRRGLSFQPDLRLGVASPKQARALLAAFPTLVAIPSNYYWTGFTASFNPIRQLTGRVMWGKNRQILGRNTQNQYSQWEATLGYQFRLLNLEFGYINHEQNFGIDFFSRNRIYFRVVRDFQLF